MAAFVPTGRLFVNYVMIHSSATIYACYDLNMFDKTCVRAAIMQRQKLFVFV